MIRLFSRLRYLAAIAFFAASFWGYRLVRVEVSEHDRVRARLADELASQVGSDLPEFNGYPRVAVLPLANDDAGVTRVKLCDGLQRAGYNVVQPGWFEHARNWVTTDTPINSSEQAQTAARDLDVQYALYGSVTKLVTAEPNPALETSLTLVNSGSGKTISEKVYRVPSNDPPLRYQSIESHASNFAWSSAGCWMAIALSLPIGMSRFLRRILRRRSNEQNAAMLLAYAVLVASLGWLLLVKSAGGWIVWTSLTVGTLGSLVYYGYLCGQLGRVE